MKLRGKLWLLAGLAVVGTLTGVLLYGDEDFRPTLVTLAPDLAFSPGGFDNNDDTQVVLDGVLPNTCYRVGPVETRYDLQNRRIVIKNQAYYYPGSWCAQVTVPYTQTVKLGIVPEGNYEVLVENADHSLVRKTDMPVAMSRNVGPDDFLYAPVTEAYFRRRGDGEAPVVFVGGTFSRCMRMTDVRVVYRPERHVIEVLPVAELVEGDNCSPQSRSFLIPVEIRTTMRGRTLIHVRSLNGQALNQIVDL